ncbi:phospholipase D-like domain-containing protein [Verrucomicrobiaceae bacterium 227]
MLKAAKRALLLLPLLSTPSCFNTTVDASVGLTVPVRSLAFAPQMTEVANTPWISGNQVRTLPNGDAFFPPMLEAVKKARHTITFETFAFVDAPITRDFSEALAAKARQGVAVHMILDKVGSRKAGPDNVKLLREAGVELHFFHPLNYFLPRRSNNRTHRKILVVDGHTAFTGGAGFAYAWSGNAHSPKHWRDTQYEVRGPAVALLQKSFNENWQELTGTKLQGPSYFPPLTPTGSYRVQVLSDGPFDDSQTIAHSVLAAINGARESLVMEQSYFVPNSDFRHALLRAAARGVKIEVLVPNHLVDSKPTRYASQNHWAPLLKSGIRIYQYEPTMMHCKLLVADGRFSIVGSANLDNRSFFINDEINLHIDSAAFAREQTRMFRRDLTRAREITLGNLPDVLAPGYKRFFARFIETQL